MDNLLTPIRFESTLRTQGRAASHLIMPKHPTNAKSSSTLSRFLRVSQLHLRGLEKALLEYREFRRERHHKKAILTIILIRTRQW